MEKKYYSPTQRRATYKYRETNIKRITLDLNWQNRKDAVILAWLTSQPNKSRAIKDALHPTAQKWCETAYLEF